MFRLLRFTRLETEATSLRMEDQTLSGWNLQAVFSFKGI